MLLDSFHMCCYFKFDGLFGGVENSIVQVDCRVLPIDDLVAIQEGLTRVDVPHLQAEKVLFGDH